MPVVRFTVSLLMMQVYNESMLIRYRCTVEALYTKTSSWPHACTRILNAHTQSEILEDDASLFATSINQSNIWRYATILSILVFQG